MNSTYHIVPFSGLIDLASSRLGGKALFTNDDFFASKNNLLKPTKSIFIEDKYTECGKWMDGWESRRKRVFGNDYCVIELGLPGVIRAFDIDTRHFLGNHAPFASVDGVYLKKNEPFDCGAVETYRWTPVLRRVSLQPGASNLNMSQNTSIYSHLRLNIFPDGGVARFRVYGEPEVILPESENELVDLIGIQNGGIVTGCSDMFFSPMTNLILPTKPQDMWDGWETRRRREFRYKLTEKVSHDWVIIKLGHVGVIQQLEVDTSHFKGNYPDRCEILYCNEPHENIDGWNLDRFNWQVLLPESKLSPDTVHVFESQLKTARNVSHIMLKNIPDGGIARLRAWGIVSNA